MMMALGTGCGASRETITCGRKSHSKWLQLAKKDQGRGFAMKEKEKDDIKGD